MRQALRATTSMLLGPGNRRSTHLNGQWLFPVFAIRARYYDAIRGPKTIGYPDGIRTARAILHHFLPGFSSNFISVLYVQCLLHQVRVERFTLIPSLELDQCSIPGFGPDRLGCCMCGLGGRALRLGGNCESGVCMEVSGILG